MEIWERATEFHSQGNYAEAEELYDQLLTQNPKNQGLLATLGTLYLQTGKYGLSIALFEACLTYGKEQSDILSNLGVAYKSAGLLEKSRDCLERSMRCSNPSAQGIANYSGLFVEGDADKCIELCKKAVKLNPELVIAHWNMALALLSEGRWKEGWKEHEWGLREKGMRIDRKIGNLPEWDGTPNKTVVVYGEQGIGDEIMFASMLPDILKTNKVVLECHQKLLTLFERSFPGVKCYGTRESAEIEWLADEQLDYRLSIGSLGKFYRNSRKDFPGTPYLSADPIPKADKFRVGISWTGGLRAGRVLKRTVPLSWWKSILNVSNVEFVSLQYTDAQEEIDLVNALGYDIKVMDEYVKTNDYYNNARLVKSCDLVISVCTSVIHLAGALGVPCWVITPKNPAWRYQNKGGMPWYRSVRLYRKPDEHDDAWIPVIQRIGLDLEELVNKKESIAA